MALLEGAPSAGALLREWRQRRNLSQLELALRSAISARHLSFIETGRAHPSREMILHLAEHWNGVAFNRGVAYVNHNVAPELRTPPANALRIALHPDGLAPQISNPTDWSGFLLARLRREIEASGDPELEALYEELSAYPGVAAEEDLA